MAEGTETESVEVEEIETDDVDVEGDSDDEGNDEQDTPEESELQRVLDTLRKVRSEKQSTAKEKRQALKELEAARKELEALKNAKDNGVKPDEVASLKSELEKLQADSQRYRDIAITKEATLALKEAGAKVAPNRLIKLLDLRDVEIGSDGTIDGLSEAIEELKEESPDFFRSDDDEDQVVGKKRAAVKRVPGIEGGAKPPAAPPKVDPYTAALIKAGIRPKA